MRSLFGVELACAAFALVQCTPRQFNGGSEVKDAPVSGGVTQINPKAFNAFNIWRDGQGSEILDYPQGYDYRGDDRTTPDGVFYVENAAYWKDKKFMGVPTAGAKVVNDVLEYPVQNGKQLKLKFTETSEKKMYLADAVTYCKDQGLRLPTARELFDFCAAGVTEPNYGPNFYLEKYPSTARCERSIWIWSASVYSDYRRIAWLFSGFHGYVNPLTRNDTGGVRCVGGG
jgi:hypothetical protein